MDRCALFVDAGYVLADGAMAVHGTRRRESVSWDYPGLLQLLANLAMERSRMPLLRCYWYDSTVEGRRSADHDALADLPGVKLRLAKMRPGRREGVEGEIHRDLTTLARNKAVSDAMVVSAEEDLAQVIADVQDLGMRVTLLHIATDGNSEIPRALRQECDDIVQISAAQLGPFAELISGAEPPRRDEADSGLLALHAGSNGNANGYANGRALLGRAAQHAAERPEEDRPEPARELAAAYETVADYGSADGYRPLDDYQAGPDYSPALAKYGANAAAPSVPDFTPAPVAPAPIAAVARPEFTARAEAHPQPDGQFRPELPEPPALPVREELYAAPVAVPPVAEEHLGHLNAERTQARPVQEPDAVRAAPRAGSPIASAYGPGESGYNPGGRRDQYQLEAPGRDMLAADQGDRYQPVPVAAQAAAPGGAAIRRLPVPDGGRGGQPALDQPSFGPPSPVPPSSGQPSFGQPSFDQPSFGQPSFGQPQGQGSGPSPQDQGSGGQPIAPVLPMEQPGQGYGANRGPAYGGPRPVTGPIGLVGQPSGPAAHAGPVDSGQPVRPGQPGPDGYPSLSPVAAGPSVGQPEAGGAPGYSGGQSGVSLADAVQSAHEEGTAFGESVARDAPALWLEAVLARKPRMPSDLEARLLQGSALPIDFLLHDEVRHALRRGFWDALEHARR